MFLNEVLALTDVAASPSVATWFAGKSSSEQQAFAALMTEQRVGALLYEHLHASGRHIDLPLPVLAAALDATRAALSDLGARRQAVITLLQALHDAGLAPLVVGGAALAHQLYQPTHSRPFRDITLLISPDARPRTRVVLDLLTQRGRLASLNVTCETHLGAGAVAGLPTYDEAKDHSVALPALGDSARTISRPAALLLTLAKMAAPTPRLIWQHDAWRLLQMMPRNERRTFLQLAGQARLNTIAAAGLKNIASQFERAERGAAHFLAAELTARAARLPREPGADHLAARSAGWRRFLPIKLAELRARR